MSLIALIEWLLNNVAELLLLVANSILKLDYLYIEWIFSLITPFCMFVLLLFSLPLVFVLLSFGAAFYIFINKHRAKLMVSLRKIKRIGLSVSFLFFLFCFVLLVITLVFEFTVLWHLTFVTPYISNLIYLFVYILLY